MNHLFLISSAIKTKFGIFDVEERTYQTFQTIDSIQKRIPTAKIVIIESSGVPLEQDRLSKLRNVSNLVVNMSGDNFLNRVFYNTDNWDLVKNMSELTAFNSALTMLEEQTDIFEGVDRIHKISGRYTLNGDFNLNVYTQFPDKIILPMRSRSQFIEELNPGGAPFNTNIPFQYMSRLWSWPKSLHKEIKKFYRSASDEFVRRARIDSKVDMEHLLFLLLPPEHIQEIPLIGIRGRLGQNGSHVDN
jgi:hypothetical protein